MKTDWKKEDNLEPKNKRMEPSDEQQLEDNHLDGGESEETEVGGAEQEETETFEIEEDDDDDELKQKADYQVPEHNMNTEQNRGEVDSVKELEGAESNKITNRESDIVNKTGQ